MKNKERENIFFSICDLFYYVYCIIVYEIRESHQIVVNRLYGKTDENLQRTMYYLGLVLSEHFV